MSFIPGITLDYFSPGLFWRPCWRLWLFVAKASLWALVLRLSGKLLVIIMSTEIWNDDMGLIELLLLGWVTLLIQHLLHFTVRATLTAFMVATVSLTVANAAHVVGGICNLIQLRPFALPPNRPFIFLATNLALSSILSIGLGIQVCNMSFWFKQEGGILWIPYVL